MSATSCDVTKIQDEDILRKMWQETEDFGRKKEIRAHMYKLREARLRDFYTNEATEKDIRRSHSSTSMRDQRKLQENTHHADSLLDHSFLSLKSKEIRDSESPTRDITYKINDKLSTDKGWTVRETKERSQDGKTHSINRLATTSGSEVIDKGVANYAAKNEQHSSVYQDGDDKNFVKSVGASNRSVIQQEARGGDDNSQFYSTSTTTKSSSKFVSEQKSSSDDFDNQQRDTRRYDFPEQSVTRKTYDYNIPEEFKKSPNYVEGKTKVFTETKTLPDGSTVTTTRYETVGGRSSYSTTKKQVNTQQEQQQQQNVSSRQTVVRRTGNDGTVRTEEFVIHPNLEVKYIEGERDHKTVNREEIRNQHIDRRFEHDEINRNQRIVEQQERDERVSRDQKTTCDVRVVRNQTEQRGVDDQNKTVRTVTRRTEHYEVDDDNKRPVNRDEIVITRSTPTETIITTKGPTQTVVTKTTTVRKVGGRVDDKTVAEDFINTEKQQRVQESGDVRKIVTKVVRKSDEEYLEPIMVQRIPQDDNKTITKVTKTRVVTSKTYDDREPSPAKQPSPKNQQPDYYKPATQDEPKYQQPEFQRPTPQEPKYQQPEFQRPTSQEPKYQQPESCKPKYETPERRQPIKQKPEIDSRTKPTEGQYDTTYRTDYINKKISVEVSPTHDAFARSLRSVTPERDRKSVSPSLRTSTSSLRSSTSPEKRYPRKQSPDDAPKRGSRYSPESRDSSPRKSVPDRSRYTPDWDDRKSPRKTPDSPRRTQPNYREESPRKRPEDRDGSPRKTKPSYREESPKDRDVSPRKVRPSYDSPRRTPQEGSPGKDKPLRETRPNYRDETPERFNESPKKTRPFPSNRDDSPRKSSQQRDESPRKTRPSPDKSHEPSSRKPVQETYSTDTITRKKQTTEIDSSTLTRRNKPKENPRSRSSSPTDTVSDFEYQPQPQITDLDEVYQKPVVDSPTNKRTPSTETITTTITKKTKKITERSPTSPIKQTQSPVKDSPRRSSLRSTRHPDTDDFKPDEEEGITRRTDTYEERCRLILGIPDPNKPRKPSLPEKKSPTQRRPSEEQPRRSSIQKPETPRKSESPVKSKPGEKIQEFPAQIKKSPEKRPKEGTPVKEKPKKPDDSTQLQEFPSQIRKPKADSPLREKPRLDDVQDKKKSPLRETPTRNDVKDSPTRKSPESKPKDDSPIKEKPSGVRVQEFPAQTRKTPERLPKEESPLREKPRKTGDAPQLQEFPSQTRKSPLKSKPDYEQLTPTKPKKKSPKKSIPKDDDETTSEEEYEETVETTTYTTDICKQKPKDVARKPKNKDEPEVCEVTTEYVVVDGKKVPKRKPQDYDVTETTTTEEYVIIGGRRVPKQPNRDYEITESTEEYIIIDGKKVPRKPKQPDTEDITETITTEEYVIIDGRKYPKSEKPDDKQPKRGRPEPKQTCEITETVTTQQYVIIDGKRYPKQDRPDDNQPKQIKPEDRQPKPKETTPDDKKPRKPKHPEDYEVTETTTTDEYVIIDGRKYPKSEKPDDKQPKRDRPEPKQTCEITETVTTEQYVIIDGKRYPKQDRPDDNQPKQIKPEDRQPKPNDKYSKQIKPEDKQPKFDDKHPRQNRPKDKTPDFETTETVTTEEYVIIGGKKVPKKPKQPNTEDYEVTETTTTEYVIIDGRKYPKQDKHKPEDKPKSKGPEYEVTETTTTEEYVVIDGKKVPRKPKQPNSEDYKVTETTTTEEYVIIDGRKYPKQDKPSQIKQTIPDDKYPNKVKPEDKQPQRPGTKGYTVTTEEYVTTDNRKQPKKSPTKDEPKRVVTEEIETVTTEEYVTIDGKKQPRPEQKQPKTTPQPKQPKYDITETVTTEEHVVIDGKKQPKRPEDSKQPKKPEDYKQLKPAEKQVKPVHRRPDVEDYEITETVSTTEYVVIDGKKYPKKPDERQPKQSKPKDDQPRRSKPTDQYPGTTEVVTTEECVVIDNRKQPKSQEKPRRQPDEYDQIREVVTTEEYIIIDGKRQPKPRDNQPSKKHPGDYEVTETVTTDEYIIVDGKRQPKKQPKDYEITETVTTEEYIIVDGKRQPKKQPKVTETITTEEYITVDGKRQPKKQPKDYDVTKTVTTEEYITVEGKRQPKKQPKDYDVTKTVTTEEYITIDGKRQPKKTPEITETMVVEEYVVIDGKKVLKEKPYQPKELKPKQADVKPTIKQTPVEDKPRKSPEKQIKKPKDKTPEGFEVDEVVTTTTTTTTTKKTKPVDDLSKPKSKPVDETPKQIKPVDETPKPKSVKERIEEYNVCKPTPKQKPLKETTTEFITKIIEDETVASKTQPKSKPAQPKKDRKIPTSEEINVNQEFIRRIIEDDTIETYTQEIEKQEKIKQKPKQPVVKRKPNKDEPDEPKKSFVDSILSKITKEEYDVVNKYSKILNEDEDDKEPVDEDVITPKKVKPVLAKQMTQDEKIAHAIRYSQGERVPVEEPIMIKRLSYDVYDDSDEEPHKRRESPKRPSPIKRQPGEDKPEETVTNFLINEQIEFEVKRSPDRLSPVKNKTVKKDLSRDVKPKPKAKDDLPKMKSEDKPRKPEEAPKIKHKVVAKVDLQKPKDTIKPKGTTVEIRLKRIPNDGLPKSKPKGVTREEPHKPKTTGIIRRDDSPKPKIRDESPKPKPKNDLIKTKPQKTVLKEPKYKQAVVEVTPKLKPKSVVDVNKTKPIRDESPKPKLGKTEVKKTKVTTCVVNIKEAKPKITTTVVKTVRNGVLREPLKQPKTKPEVITFDVKSPVKEVKKRTTISTTVNLKSKPKPGEKEKQPKSKAKPIQNGHPHTDDEEEVNVRRKCVSTKSIIINDTVADEREIIVNLQRSKSSREETPDRVWPVATDEDTGIPRYPDQISEPEEPRRVLKKVNDVPLAEDEDVNEFSRITELIDAKITEVDRVQETDECLLTVNEKVNKFSSTPKAKPKNLGPAPKIERPKLVVDEELEKDDCLLSVSDKVSKFITTAEKLGVQEVPERPKSPRCQNIPTDCLTEKVNKFIESAELLTKRERSPPKKNSVDVLPVITRSTFEDCSTIVTEEDMYRTPTNRPEDNRPSKPNARTSPEKVFRPDDQFTPTKISRESPERVPKEKVFRQPEEDQFTPGKVSRVSPVRDIQGTPDKKIPRESPERVFKSPQDIQQTPGKVSRVSPEKVLRSPQDDQCFPTKTPHDVQKIPRTSPEKVPQRQSPEKVLKTPGEPKKTPDSPKKSTYTTPKDAKTVPSNKIPGRNFPDENTTPKSSKRDETRLRSTETVKKARALFENYEKERPRQIDILSRPSVFEGRKLKLENTDELKSTKIIESIRRSQSPGEVPHYMTQIERTVRQGSPQKDSPEKSSSPARERIPEKDRPHEDIPHYMTQLDRTLRQRSPQKESSPVDLTKTPERVRTPVNENIPHYMTQLDRSLRQKSPHIESVRELEEIAKGHIPHPDEGKPNKFGVVLRRTESGRLEKRRTSTTITLEIDGVKTDIDIEEIYDLEVLENLLEKIVGYDLRRRIRAQIRVVKKLIEEQRIETVTTKKVYKLVSPAKPSRETPERKRPTPDRKTETTETRFERRRSSDVKIETRQTIRTHSPESKVITKTTIKQEIVRSKSPEFKTDSRTVKGKSPEVVSRPRGQSPEVVSKPRGKSPEVVSRPRGKSPEAISRPRGKTPEHVSKPRGKSPEVKIVSDKRKVVPELKKVPDADDDKPEWVKQRNLKKVTERTVVTKKTPVKEEPARRKSPEKETNVITSSYGVGPTDENGSPLFGLRALRAQNKNEHTKVQGMVTHSTFYSENGSEPVGEVSMTKYSTDPRDLGVDDPEHGEGILSKTTVQKFGYKDTPSYKTLSDKRKPTEKIDETRTSSTTTTTKVSRRGSVKEMSQKFLDNAVETLKSEKQSSYPKAGLILRTSSFKDGSGGSSREGSPTAETEEIRKTVKTVKTSGKKGESFLTNTSKVTGVQDVITRMKTEDYVEGDTEEDAEARTMLNKFLGSQVLLSGMESQMRKSSAASAATTTTTCGSTTKRITKVTTTITENGVPRTTTRSYTHPVTPDVLETISDEQTLRLLLDQSEEYEERRIIRARLKLVMAEKGECSEFVEKTVEENVTGNVQENVETTTRKVYSEGPFTQTRVTTTRTQQVKKTMSPFAKFRELDKQNPPSIPPSTSKTPSKGGALFKCTDQNQAQSANSKIQFLLQWCKMKTREYENVNIINFSSSWADGLAFCALVHHFLPDAFNYHELSPKNRKYNFTLAFQVAYEKADIYPLLFVEDMIATSRPDWKCVFTYVQAIYIRFKNED